MYFGFVQVFCVLTVTEIFSNNLSDYPGEMKHITFKYNAETRDLWTVRYEGMFNAKRLHLFCNDWQVMKL